MKTNKLGLIRIASCIALTLFSFSCSHEEMDNRINEEIILEDTGEVSPSLARTNGVMGANEFGKEERKSIDDRLKIIRNANCRIKVKDVTEATLLTKKMVSKYNGYVSEEKFVNTNYKKENSCTIRIPEGQFDAVLDSICNVAEFIDHKNITTIDVTEEYVDITSRLKTKFEVKQRYETILMKRAKTVEDILKTEEKLSKLQEEIESAQGRLNYLGNKVAYSTIHIDIYETVIPVKEPEEYKPGFFDKIKKGVNYGWSLVQSIVIAVFYLWPFLVLGVIVFIYFRKLRK
ncbi:DUF4349 domain-containing protein [Aquimarina pacifica]|uniref:DUF4349 domain-containing protein n=1 Tax=Aquimarina pacifica TaxID=1296415 RepID=UPI0004B127B2|nr:DUF4349 domain-containing protein [Aquimarina pacifica]